MNSHVGLEVAFSCECSTADLTFEWSLASVNTVMHLQCTFTAEDPVTNDTLIGVTELVFNVVNKLL